MSEEKNRFLQRDKLDDLRRARKLTDMITVYESDVVDNHHNYGVFCALIPNEMVDKALSDPGWELHHYEGAPDSAVYGHGPNRSVEYLRYGNFDGIEPLVIDRNFGGVRENYVELSEEFRLFHNLYHDRKNNQYIKIEDSGKESVIANVNSNQVKIRLKEIRQFLAVKKMHLSVQFDHREFTNIPLREMGLVERQPEKGREDLLSWSWSCGDVSFGCPSFSRLLGKRLYGPLPESKSGFFGFDEDEKKYEKFIIDIDENGDEVEFTPNPDKLANFFGANPDAPNYLTPVYFRKDVLDKYRRHPSKYTVGPSLLGCGSLWAFQMDNHHEDKVCAWLGDLGRDLPHEEQLHWRAHNIAPAGGVSETFYRNQILAQPTNSTNLEHVFSRLFRSFHNLCQTRLGWCFFLQLKEEDEYHLKTMRIPTSNEQLEFDELILGLTKILVDSLNVKKLRKFVSNGDRVSGSIDTLREALSAMGATGYEGHVSFLKDLQSLRSSGSAHRKGEKYGKISRKFGMEERDLRDVFRTILEESCDFLRYLIRLVESGRIGDA